MDQLQQQLGPELGGRVADEIAKKLAERPPGSSKDVNINVIIEQQGDEPTDEQKHQMDIVREVYRQKLKAVPEELRDRMKRMVRMAHNLGGLISLYKLPAMLDDQFLNELGDENMVNIANFTNFDTFMRAARTLMIVLRDSIKEFDKYPVLYMEMTKRSVYEIIEDTHLIISHLAGRSIHKEEVINYVSPLDKDTVATTTTTTHTTTQPPRKTKKGGRTATK